MNHCKNCDKQVEGEIARRVWFGTPGTPLCIVCNTAFDAGVAAGTVHLKSDTDEALMSELERRGFMSALGALR